MRSAQRPNCLTSERDPKVSPKRGGSRSGLVQRHGTCRWGSTHSHAEFPFLYETAFAACFRTQPKHSGSETKKKKRKIKASDPRFFAVRMTVSRRRAETRS
jgi:hypothetical protein